jgi:hypothetical protein
VPIDTPDNTAILSGLSISLPQRIPAHHMPRTVLKFHQPRIERTARDDAATLAE